MKTTHNNESITRPCAELKYCPYIPLVEEFEPASPDDERRCNTWGHICPVYYPQKGLELDGMERLLNPELILNIKTKGANKKKRTPIRQNYNMPVDKKIEIYRSKMTDKERRKYVRKIVKALQSQGIDATEEMAESIMWVPHLVIRRIKGKTVYDCSQPLCFSETDTLAERAVLALKTIGAFDKSTSHPDCTEQKSCTNDAQQDKRETAFRLAKETGEPQFLTRYMAECNDPKEQCSLDHVTVCAMPDGTTKRERQHTW